MRLALVFVVVGLAGACKGKSEADAATDPAALKAQQELVTRRDQLLKARQQLQSDREKVIEEIKKVEATGGDTSELVKKRADLDHQIEGQSSQLIDALSSKLDVIATNNDVAANVTAREASMGNREGRLADRERGLADRERNLAERERQLAQREKDTCSATPIVMQAPPPPHGASYTRKDVEPLLRDARTAMQAKGIVPGDLGAQAGLENESTKAMADNDWGRAYLAAYQLDQTVKGIKVDRTFIQQKYNRLHARVSSGKQDEATTKQLTDGMTEVMQRFGDGDFGAANKRLNQLWGLVH